MTKPYPHYSSFGSLIPNRSWSDASREYRYGFNGKEKDFETAADNYDFGARIYDGRLGRWLSLDPHFNRYPSISPYVSLINKPICFIDPNGKDVIILIWATKYNDVGHTAFAVAEYEEIIEIITEEIWVRNDNPTPEDIKSGNLGEWVTIQRTVRTGKFRPTGLYTLYELGPDADLNKGTSDDDVNAEYTKKEHLTLDQIMGEKLSDYDDNQADGVILIKTDKKTDETIHYELGVIYPIISPTSMYNGFTNNCTDYGKKAAELATGESIDAEEELRGQPVTTPNKLYNALKNNSNTTVLRNADKKTKHNFVRSFLNIFRKK